MQSIEYKSIFFPKIAGHEILPKLEQLTAHSSHMQLAKSTEYEFFEEEMRN